MKKKYGIDKIQSTIEDIVKVYPDVVSALESDDKITLAEGGILAVKHAGKVFKFFVNIPMISKEVIDIDSEEAGVIFDKIAENMGGSKEVKAALKKIVLAMGQLNEGIQELVEAKKAA